MDQLTPSGMPPNLGAGAPHAAAPTPQQTPGGFEFDVEQNRIFGELAGSMKFVATCLQVFGVLAMVFGLFFLMTGSISALVTALLEGAVMLMIGTWTRSAAGSINEIVTTEGNDIGSLMSAMRDLGRVYNLQKILFIAALCIFVAAFVFGALFMPHAIR